MSKINSQKGAVQISTFAGMAIIAAVVVIISIIAVIKYREVSQAIVPVAVITPKLSPSVTLIISQAVKEKLESLIIGKINSEEMIDIIIFSYDTPNQDMVKFLQKEGVENVKLIESEPIKKEGVESRTKDGEPLFITATIKAKNAVNIAELSWVRRIALDLKMTGL